MNINKKYIIIFGTLILLLVIITGVVTYYKEKAAGLVELPEQNEYFSPPISKDKEYTIWCYGDGMGYDCSNEEFFESGESVVISVNLTQFDNILYDPYFLCWYTDLKGGSEKQCMSRSASPLEGFILKNQIIPEDKGIFTLLKFTIYPDNNFEEANGITIMDLTGKLIK